MVLFIKKLFNWSQDFGYSNGFVAGIGHLVLDLGRQLMVAMVTRTVFVVQASKSSRSQENIRINIRTNIIKELEYLNTLTRFCFARATAT